MRNTVFEDLLGLEQDIENLFLGYPLPVRYSDGRSIPSMNVADTGEAVLVTMDLPGVSKEDVKISKKDNLLTISGERKRASVPDGAKWLRNETVAGSFARTLELPRHLSTEGVSAELVDGVLRITVPKAEEAKPREIAIR
jgi:HSP20 family protein